MESAAGNMASGNTDLCAAFAGLRVVFVFDALELGGAERQGLLLASHMKDELGAWVDVVGLSRPGRLTEMCDELCIPWHLIPATPLRERRRLLTSMLQFALALRHLKPDVLMPYTMYPNVMCGSVWRLTGARTCVWNQRDEGSHRVRSWLEKWAVRQTPCFVANSRGGSTFLTESLRVAPSRVATVMNGVQLEPSEHDRATWRERLGAGDDCIVCCMVANLHKNKDHATLLKAWRMVVDSAEQNGQHVLLALAGRPSGNEVGVEEMIRELGLNDAVRLLGPVTDVAGLLAAIDIGVHSSPSEGCPNSVLEFMAAGLPVVGTDIDGIRDVMNPAAYSLLAVPGDVRGLAEAICRLVGSPDLRREFAAGNQKHAQEEFSPRVMCQRMSHVVFESLGKRRDNQPCRA